MPAILLLIQTANAKFSGFDVILYYWYMIRTLMWQYSWQVRVAYVIILICILALAFLMIMFYRMIKKRRNYEKEYKQCSNSYYEAFAEILETRWEYTAEEILEACDATEEDFGHYDGLILADLICRVRMDMREVPFLPNLQLLAEVTGARRAIEYKLGKNQDVSKCLQMVCTMPLMIQEGLLALYVSNKDPRIKQLARLAHMIVSPTEPFLYLQRDMNREMPPVYRIIVHRIMGWRDAQGQMVAPLLMMAQTATNTEMAAFMITEASFWGTDEDKAGLVDFLYDKRVQCRIAAIEALQKLKLPDAEDKMYQAYEQQPQAVRRLILVAIKNFHSGKYADFFVQVYNTTPSHTSRQIALECLLSYSDQGKALFEELYASSSENEKVLFDQVRTMSQLNANS